MQTACTWWLWRASWHVHGPAAVPGECCTQGHLGRVTGWRRPCQGAVLEPRPPWWSMPPLLVKPFFFLTEMLFSSYQPFIALYISKSLVDFLLFLGDFPKLYMQDLYCFFLQSHGIYYQYLHLFPNMVHLIVIFSIITRHSVSVSVIWLFDYK